MNALMKARQLRKKLHEQKVQQEKEEKKENPPEEKKEEEKEKPKSKPPLKPSALKQTENPVSSKKEEPKEEKKIDPLDFFNQEHPKEKEPEEVNEELNELLNMIEGDDKKEKEEEKKKKDNSSDSDSNSSSESDEENNAEQRLINKQKAQAKLFANKNNRVSPTNNLFKQKKISEEITKEQILEKYGADFDKVVELPELNEQKKQIMLKKLRNTINKMSSQRIQKHMDAELRQQIEEKIEDLKKVKGANYNKIESKVQELILSLKQPDFYFNDDEDVTQISDVQEKMDIKPRTDIDFEFFMKQTPKTN
jgi:hypothetical protein